MKMNVCSKCGTSNENNTWKCIKCGEPFPLETLMENSGRAPSKSPNKNVERRGINRLNKTPNSFLVGGIAGFIGGLAKFFLFYTAESFGMPIFCLFMPVISPVAGVLSIYILNYFIEKSESYYLIFCASAGFLAGFLPFFYYMMF